MNVIENIPPKNNGYDNVAIDLEIFGAYGEQLHRPQRGGEFACMSLCGDSKNVYIIKKQADIQTALERVDKACWTFHNAAFDWPWLRYLVGELPDRPSGLFWDTLLIERDLWGGYYDSFSLADLYRRYFSKILDKRQQKKFIEGTELNKTMITYAAKDALATWQIREVQEPFLEADEGTKHIWNVIDAPAFWAIQAFKGFRMDKERWLGLSGYFDEKAKQIEGELGFNPRSSKQAQAALIDAGIHVNSTNEKVLKAYEDHPLVAKILECRGYSKSASTYGEEFVNKFLEKDGVHGMFDVTKAYTGRLASNSPNMQNIPRDLQFRSCFVPAPGNVIIKADYQAQEPRITAALSGDHNMIAAFKAGEDIHLTSTRTVYSDDTIPSGDPRRKAGKDTQLAVTYGQGPKALSRARGITEKEAAIFIDRLKKRFPGIPRMTERLRREAAHYGFARTLGGRRIWINSWMGYHAANEAVNGPHQGTGADMMKLALSKIYKASGKDYCLVITVHDEVDADCPKGKAKKMAKLIQTCMLEAFSEIAGKEVPGAVEVAIAKNWAGEQ